MNTPKPANGEAMALNARKTLLDAEDIFAAAKDLNEAIYMACGHIENDIEKSAIQAVSIALHSKLSAGLMLIEQAQEAL